MISVEMTDLLLFIYEANFLDEAPSLEMVRHVNKLIRCPRSKESNALRATHLFAKLY
jgi:hypothetical protein